MKAMVAKRPDGEYSVDYVPSAPGEQESMAEITRMFITLNLFLLIITFFPCKG